MSEVALQPATRSGSFGFGWLRTALTLALFIGGIAGGAYAQRLVQPGPPPNPYQQLPIVGEPPEAAELVGVIVRDDARALANFLDADGLKSLGQALQPIDEVLEAKYVGGAERKGDTLAAYVLTGNAGQMGQKVTVGVVLRVRDGKVVGIN